MEGRSQTVPLVPAAGLLLFALVCGTFAGGATAGGAVTAHLILGMAVGFFGWRIAVPAGTNGVLLGVAWVAVALPWWASPVPRAGSSAVVLVPMFLILPWLVAWCWRLDGVRPGDEAAPRTPLGRAGRAQRGVFGVGLVVIAVSARGLWGWLRLGTDGASLPLGHHNLLAAFLVTTLPLAALGWRSRGLFRGVAAASVALGGATLLATRSLAGALGLAAVVVAWGLAARWTHPSQTERVPRRSLAWALALSAGSVVGLGLVFGGRILSVVAGSDPSTLARLGYWRAGLRGILERPLLGWGPGSTPWTVHEFFRPVPGVHPPDQVLADLHSVPLQLLYELGLVGCGLGALALGGVAWTLRRRPVVDRGLVAAGLAGLVGFAVASLGGLPLSVTAVPVAVTLAAGAVLAGWGVCRFENPPPTPPFGKGGAPGSRAVGHLPNSWHPATAKTTPAVLSLAFLYLAAAAWVLAPRDAAHFAYERARAADALGDRVAELERAVSLDPDFPLYRWRLALERGDPEMAGEAAERAPAVAAFRLTAGEWDAACRLSALGAMAPFRASLATDDPAVTARAILAQPWWLASIAWRDRTDTVDRAVARLVDDPRVEIGWRAELRDVWAEIRAMEGEPASMRRLVLDVDDDPPTSLSLHTFRRSPWPARIAEAGLDPRRLGPVAEMPPATILPATVPSLLRSESCAVGDP